MSKDLENLLERVLVPDKNIKRRSYFRIKHLKIFSLLVLILTISAFIFSARGKTEDEKILKKISKFVVLPEDKLTTAIVKDVNLLKNNPFFHNANNGDKLFMFEKSEKIFLYSVSLGKIINIGHLKEAGIDLD
ncbi:MAG: hypothetical protein A3B86_00855 [Candidatus Yanofskybacteria bacterium RIFCSPHIGHO2_02_FULL_38_22b]|uniref:Uncharacterized protein n=1 Tax=Candidatus Yanofskybacteria bacterium RIFCSPHIGHO2_02_FULL_38_22b TaxID=1802673 RepID=A0A1F8F3J8_9BACT|nr:MAG: hypothetical protein A2816_02745 [Candidatus Yanofskybacteria bacterium RIFCSPHIGHO2_01_FULL_39_44]OGN07712.1 MAG: hypothetical protein A3B86_00855 [Candidatus Yanofskybacteria bacterium RIFCSPHIGHO2_02_FULL_38_22b]